MEVSIPKIVQEDGKTTFPIATFIVFIFLTLVLRDLAGNVIALTTSFLALNFSDSPPFAHMGTASAIGIIFAMIASLTFLPAAIYYLPSKAKGLSTMPKLGGSVSTYQKHGNLIIVAFTLVIISLSALIPKNILDDNFIEFFDETLEVRKDIGFLTDNIGDSAVVNISIPATEQGGILEPEYLTLLDELDNFLSQQPELRFTTSLLA